MPFDGLLLSRVVNKLQEYEGAKIGKIQSLSDEEILLFLHKPQKAAPGWRFARIPTRAVFIWTKKQGRSAQSFPFVMLLRKRISQGYITAIEQMGYDRIVRFHIVASNEFSDRVEYDLYAEMMGKYANLILVDSRDQTIIDCLKRIPVYENSKRLLHPGRFTRCRKNRNGRCPNRRLRSIRTVHWSARLKAFRPRFPVNFCTACKTDRRMKKFTTR
ncbi:NFACT family protein [Allobaculum sp. Allo2]|uniref:NFACT family protein n=1 Tax=Allobaculum sp. Allo2 TaxID=2853432 RepID=UPI001F61749C|nr:NFACT family protein [Allobaculum sp. Allo2]UNT92540.1 NFACT family protein [Allobaculum sp. Allo2]